MILLGISGLAIYRVVVLLLGAVMLTCCLGIACCVALDLRDATREARLRRRLRS